jgi:phage terminase small subunit
VSNLTEKQKAFADYYITSLNATESYKNVYKTTNQASAEANASRLLSNDKVSKYINERLTEVKTNRIATIEDIMNFHTDVMNNEYEKLGYNKPLYVKDRQVSAQELTKRLELMYKLDSEKKQIDIEYVKAKVELLKGSKKDTSLLDALVGVFKE